MANSAFVTGMTDAMFISAMVMAAAAAFVFVVLPSEISCIEEECDEEDAPVAKKKKREEVEPVPATGD